ncbi:hypothetical protein FKP32DRAFT_1394201 [Trametes sanguinea]|nr:hypothetical protein FKP32DRAFT_1394201 [Trametes sanguinea]
MQQLRCRRLISRPWSCGCQRCRWIDGNSVCVGIGRMRMQASYLAIFIIDRPIDDVEALSALLMLVLMHTYCGIGSYGAGAFHELRGWKAVELQNLPYSPLRARWNWRACPRSRHLAD